jgi:hypothetical protein
MGGNVANGSPIGDSAPVLMALNARIVLRRGERVRQMPLREFYVDYMKNRLEPGEFVQGLVVPLPQASTALRAYKISKRFDCDISAVCAGLSRWTARWSARRAWPSAGWPPPSSARHAAEAAMLGRPWSEATLPAAMAALAQDFKPLSDMRASAAYRMQVAQNLLLRFWLETRAEMPAAARRRQRLELDAACSGMTGRLQMNKPIELSVVPAPAASRGRSLPHESAAPARAAATHPTPTTCPSWPARCIARSGCRRWRTACCSSASMSTALRALPGVVDVSHREGHPGRQRVRPAGARRPHPRRRGRRHAALAGPAGVRGGRHAPATPRAAPRRGPAT